MQSPSDSALAISGGDWRLSAVLALGMCIYGHPPEDERICLFVILCVCTVTDFSAEDKASGVKFCTAVYRHPGRESPILDFYLFYSLLPQKPK